DQMSLTRQFDETVVDRRLARTGATRPLADILQLGRRAAESQGLGTDQRVVKDVVRVGQHLARPDGEQAWVSGACAHQRDATRDAARRARQSRGDALRRRGFASADQVAHLRGEQPPVDPRLLRDRYTALAQVTPDAADQGGEGTPLPTEPALEPGAERRGQEGTLAGGGDRDQQRLAVHDRRGDESALRRAVDDVDHDAGRLGLRPALAVDLRVVAGVDDQARPGEDARPVLTRGDDANVRAGLPQAGLLVGGELAVADHDATLAREVDEHRVGPHALAPSFSACAASRSMRATSVRVNWGRRS